MAQKKEASARTFTQPLQAKAASRKPKTPQFVYYFGDGKADGDGTMKPLLGGKGANLAEMTRIGLPVPPGFTITTEVCTYFYAHKTTYPPALQAQVERASRTWRRSWAQVRRHEGHAAARRRALRRARFDAGHDGHDPQSRPQRRDRARARPRRRRTSASRGIATAASSRCMATWSSACRSAKAKITSRSRSVIEHYKHEKYGQHDIDDSKLDRGRLAGARRRASRSS